MRNEDDAEVVVQAETLQWSQADGQDVLDPTRDLIASPAVFTLPAKGSQLVRVALRREPDARRELSYRLVVQEVPPAAESRFHGPAGRAAHEPAGVRRRDRRRRRRGLEWSATREPTARSPSHARNPSDTHARVLGFSASPATGSGARCSTSRVATYVLPGQSHRWRFGGGSRRQAAIGDRHYQLRGRTDAGEFTDGAARSRGRPHEPETRARHQPRTRRTAAPGAAGYEPFADTVVELRVNDQPQPATLVVRRDVGRHAAAQRGRPQGAAHQDAGARRACR
ncbi:MAG: fimbria/pilus periplasmic chaperone [Desulfobacterales bacterium]|nr:fimbria/pilus periplasmic chaperone [Desulfobacterales bacterium]